MLKFQGDTRQIGVRRGSGSQGESWNRRKSWCVLYLVAVLLCVIQISFILIFPIPGSNFKLVIKTRKKLSILAKAPPVPVVSVPENISVANKTLSRTTKPITPVKIITAKPQNIPQKSRPLSQVLVKPKPRGKYYCHIPQLHPHHPTVWRFFHKPPHPSTGCTKGENLLLFRSDDSHSVVYLGNPTLMSSFNCCYKPIINNGRDDTERLSTQCVPLRSQMTDIPETVEFLQVSCRNSTMGTFYKDMLAFPHLNLTQRQGFEQSHHHHHHIVGNNTNNSEWKTREKFNVIVLGLHSVSRMNVQRSLPGFYAYLMKQLQAVEFQGYTSVGGDSLSNIVPALTGISWADLENKLKEFPPGNRTNSNRSRPIYLDEVPFIWTKFRQQGFATSFAEDAPSLGLFSGYQKGHFKSPPVDFYPRAFFKQLSTQMGNQPFMKVPQCYGSRLPLQILLAYMKQVSDITSKYTIPYFQMAWSQALFHESLSNGKVADEPLLEFLKWFKESGHFHRSILIVTGDHGFPSGEFTTTMQGLIESKMPPLFFVFPPSMKKKYPLALRNLRANSALLTSPFDLHKTLGDLLNISRILDTVLEMRNSTEFKSKSDDKTSPGISLFLRIPNRTCSKAGIPGSWCICSKNTPIPSKIWAASDILYKIVWMGVRRMNRLLSTNRTSGKCVTLKLRNITDATQVNYDFEDKSKLIYSVRFVTSPGDGHFEGRFRRRNQWKWTVDGEILRINPYRNQSFCIDQLDLKQFCHCKTNYNVTS